MIEIEIPVIDSDQFTFGSSIPEIKLLAFREDTGGGVQIRFTTNDKKGNNADDHYIEVSGEKLLHALRVLNSFTEGFGED